MVQFYARLDMMLSIIFIVISILVYYTSQNFTMGGDIFPRYLSIAIFIFSLILFFDAFKRLQKKEKTKKLEFDMSKENIFLTLRPYIAYLFIFIYVYLIPKIGYFIMTFIFTIGMMYFLGVRNIKLYLITTIGLLAGIYLLFVMQLNVPVPKGILF